MLTFIGKNFCTFRNSNKIVSFNSIIVVDIETTGLPYLENNNTRITELALLGCEVEHLQKAKTFPRVLHKMVFCFNPTKVIMPHAIKLSGLENNLLVNNKPFCQFDVDVLRHFVNRLPSPVCMIAHNGNRFDFPILQNHLHELNAKLPENVYCADSLKAFQDIYPNSKQVTGTSKKLLIKSKIGEITQTNNNSSLISSEVIPVKTSNLSMLKTCENSFEESKETESNDNNQIVVQPMNDYPLRYNLPSIYKFLHGENYFGGHRAEEDVKALLSCIIRCDKFLNWMNEKAVSFNSIKPLI